MEQMTLTEVVQDIHVMVCGLAIFSNCMRRVNCMTRIHCRRGIIVTGLPATRSSSIASSYTKSLSAKHLRRRRSRPVFRCLI